MILEVTTLLLTSVLESLVTKMKLKKADGFLTLVLVWPKEGNHTDQVKLREIKKQAIQRKLSSETSSMMK
jgi:hypothetical protein